MENEEQPEQGTQQEPPPDVDELDQDPAHEPEDENLKDLKGG